MKHVPKDPRTLAVKVPIRTVSESNQREHYMATHRRKKQQQRDVGLFLNTCRRVRLPCDVWLTRIAPNRFDPGNLEASFKHVQDQVAAWLGVDDGDTSRVNWRYEQRKGRPKEYAVLIEFFSDGGAA